MVGILRRQLPATAIWTVIGVIVLSLIVQGLAPPSDYDSLNYHLALPQRDLEQGRIEADWYGGAFAFFPQLSEHLYRLSLAVIGQDAAQPVTGLFGIFLALGSALLAQALGQSALVAALAALMTVAVRATVWELATCEVEPQLAVFTACSLLMLLRWRTGGGMPAAILFGMMVGGGALVKYHGLVIGACFLPVILCDLAAGRVRWREVAAAGIIAAAAVAPHCLRNFYYTGNPLFPLLTEIFNPGVPRQFDIAGSFGRGRSLLDFLRVAWDVSILPTWYFDGAVLGAPYFLAFAPIALTMARRPGAVPLAMVTLIYFAAWFWLLSQQVRFLIPVTPCLAVFAAVGVARAWLLSARAGKVATIVTGVLLAATQGLFVGAYAGMRLPAALGRVEPAHYLVATPTFGGSFYGACTFVRERLAPQEWILAMIAPHSYYCPQARAIVSPALPEEQAFWAQGKSLPDLDAGELAQALDRYRVRFVIVPGQREFRRGVALAPTIEDTDLQKDRFGRVLAPVLRELTPLYHDSTAAVYDGTAVMQALTR